MMTTVSFRQAALEQGIDLGTCASLGSNGDDQPYGPETGYGTRLDPADYPEEIPSESGWPSAVPIRPGNWDQDRCKYRLAYGDTLSGLAATYLYSPQRWSEIWAEQTDVMRSTRSPDHLMAGEWINMPAEALTNMLSEVQKGSGGGVIVTNGGGGGGAGAKPPMSTGKKIAIGAGVAALLGAIYLATR